MRQRDGPDIRVCCHGRKESDEVVSLVTQRVPKFRAGNCAQKGCYRNCLTLYCDLHYPRLVECADFASGNENLDKFHRIADACATLTGDVKNWTKAQLLWYDFATLNWGKIWFTRDLKMTFSSRLFHGAGCCDFYKRYAFMVCDHEFPPTVHPLV